MKILILLVDDDEIKEAESIVKALNDSFHTCLAPFVNQYVENISVKYLEADYNNKEKLAEKLINEINNNTDPETRCVALIDVILSKIENQLLFEHEEPDFPAKTAKFLISKLDEAGVVNNSIYIITALDFSEHYQKYLFGNKAWNLKYIHKSQIIGQEFSKPAIAKMVKYFATGDNDDLEMIYKELKKVG